MESALGELILGCDQFHVRGYTRCLIAHGEENRGKCPCKHERVTYIVKCFQPF